MDRRPPGLNSRRARVMFALLADELTDVLGHAAVMTDEHTRRRDTPFYSAATEVNKTGLPLLDALTKLSQGRYEEVEKDLRTNW